MWLVMWLVMWLIMWLIMWLVMWLMKGVYCVPYCVFPCSCNFLFQEHQPCEPIRKQNSKTLQFDWMACFSPLQPEVARTWNSAFCVTIRMWSVICCKGSEGGDFLESFQECVCAFASKFGLTCAFQRMFSICLRCSNLVRCYSMEVSVCLCTCR